MWLNERVQFFYWIRFVIICKKQSTDNGMQTQNNDRRSLCMRNNEPKFSARSSFRSLCLRMYDLAWGINSREIPRTFTAGRIRLETLTDRDPALISLFMENRRHLLPAE